jgi:hypothetical protein
MTKVTTSKRDAAGRSRRPLRIDTALKAAIRRDGRTHYALAVASGVSHQQIGRFMLPETDERHRGISLETAVALASVLGLELLPMS